MQIKSDLIDYNDEKNFADQRKKFQLTNSLPSIKHFVKSKNLI